MTRLGITGHQQLPNPPIWSWVEARLRNVIERLDKPIMGFTSLAAGADQRFAQILLSLDIPYTAVLPFDDYERTFNLENDLVNYRHLLENSSDQMQLHCVASDDQICFFEAGKRVVEEANLTIAIWDGLPAKGLGGTADVVRYSLEHNVPVLWFSTSAKTLEVLMPEGLIKHPRLALLEQQ